MEIREIKDILNKGKDFIETNNYYFETHTCDDKTKKINLKYILRNEEEEQNTRFGICPDCDTIFFHIEKNSEIL